MTDQEREKAINFWAQQMMDGPDRDSKLAAFAKLRELIEGRSPKQVERMERERGLRVS